MSTSCTTKPSATKTEGLVGVLLQSYPAGRYREHPIKPPSAGVNVPECSGNLSAFPDCSLRRTGASTLQTAPPASGVRCMPSATDGGNYRIPQRRRPTPGQRDGADQP